MEPLELVRDEDAGLMPCVWTSAGVLSWRPCDRGYDCESCPLYHALRGDVTSAHDPAPRRGAGGDDSVGRYLAALSSGCSVRLDRAYSAEGLWLEPDVSGAGDVVRVGIDDYMLRLLQPVDSVVLPREGVWLGRGAPCVWINRGRLAVTLRCPVAAEVVDVQSCPSLDVNARAQRATARWWFRIKPHESLAAAPALLRHEALLGWLLARLRIVRDEVAMAMAPDAPFAGPALADGGKPTPDLEMVLGRARYEALVGTLFPLPV